MYGAVVGHRNALVNLSRMEGKIFGRDSAS